MQLLRDIREKIFPEKAKVSKSVLNLIFNEVKELQEWREHMDAKIKKIEKEVAKGKDKVASKDLKSLEKMDKKRDVLVDAGKKAMKGKK